MIRCDDCGQEVEDADMYWHAVVRHSVVPQHIRDERKAYFEKYPFHRFHLGEWQKYLADKYPVISESLVKMSDSEREKICDLIARDEANRIQTEVKDEVEAYVQLQRLQLEPRKRRWWACLFL